MKKRKKSGKRSGVINGFFNYLSEKILYLLKNGMFGKAFSSSDALEQKAESGILMGTLASAVKSENNSLKRKTLKSVDESIFVGLYRRTLNYLGACKLNCYGAYSATFGFYSLLVYIIKSFVSQGEKISFELILGEDFIFSIFIMLASIPLLNSRASLKSIVYNSGLIRPFLEIFGGIPENKFDDTDSKNGAISYFVAIIFGILTGGITYFVPPLTMLIALLVIFLTVMFMCFPEFGLVTTIFVAPFLGFLSHPTVILVAMIALNFVSYVAKVLIGKRAFRFKFIDVLVALFGIMLLMGGVFTAGGNASLKAAVTYFALMAVYFLAVNLFNTRQWLDRLRGAIAIPSIIVSVYGVIGYAAVNMPSKWIDSSMFSGIESRAISVFENPNMLATYLILTAPLIWMGIFKQGATVKSRMSYILGALLSMACILLTWSRGGWIGIIAAILVFSIINYKHTLKYLIVSLIASPIWIKLVPSNIAARFSSIGNLADSSTYYRLYTWKGSLKLLADYLWGGIGVGETAFSQLYPLYSYVGTEATMHSHNLLLQIAIEIGIVGLSIFLISMFLTFQKGFSCMKNADKGVKLFVSAAISGLCAALVHGMVDHIWYNYRVFFVFWVIVAMIGVAEAVASEEARKATGILERREKAVSLDIVFDN